MHGGGCLSKYPHTGHWGDILRGLIVFRTQCFRIQHSSLGHIYRYLGHSYDYLSFKERNGGSSAGSNLEPKAGHNVSIIEGTTVL